MSDNLGSGVSRVLSAEKAQTALVIWQMDKPPLDSELNFNQQIAAEALKLNAQRQVPSGWLGNGTNSADVYETAAAWSNWFKFGRQKSGELRALSWASVNGWLIPVTGTLTGTPPGSPDDVSTWNRITLDPPPANAGDSRIDFVFLEVWQARLAPNAATNKPSASAVYTYGNVEGGMSYLAEQSQDTGMGFETTQRVQLQYRLRVVKSVGLSTYPDGFDPAVVKARGAATTDTTYTFSNMRGALGDPGLWRAGDGTANSLGTVDGYVYAIPLCTVFRRNSVLWTGAPSVNLNGGFNRNPLAVDRTNYKTFVAMTLASDVTASATSLSLSTATNIPIPAAPASPVLIKVGDELMQVSAITSTTATVTRGVQGTRAEAHGSGDTVTVVSSRPDGLFADQITRTDIHDLRHVVSPAGFDAQALLREGVDKLLRGQLRSTWKRTNGGTQGPYVAYQDKVGSVSTLGVTKIDAPDNIRLIYSDAAVTQKVLAVVKPSAGIVASTTSVAVSWGLTIAATLAVQSVANRFTSGESITFPIAQFKTGLGSDTDQVRFVNDSITDAVVLREEGSSTPIPSGEYTISPANPTYAQDLVITFTGTGPYALSKNLNVELTLQYGAGRGLGHKPDSLHSVSMNTNVGNDIMLPSGYTTSSNYGLRTGYAPLWSRMRRAVYNGQIPVTAETYADLGSKTLILQPFRRITLPANLLTQDGGVTNPGTTAIATGSGGAISGGNLLTDGAVTLSGVAVGDLLYIETGNNAGRVFVATGSGANTVSASGMTNDASGTIEYTVLRPLGLMPLLAADGVASKWTTADPLNLFASHITGTLNVAAQKNLYITLPRALVPGWGAVYSPVLWADASSGVFHEGINFGLMSKKNPSSAIDDTNQCRQYINYTNGNRSYAIFSTHNIDDAMVATPSTYNDAYTFDASPLVAGMRFFTDTRGLGRTGLELPPFYGIARLFAVYEAQDYRDNGSAYNASTRAANSAGTPAINLLRQDFTGPTFWIELDEDGDSTFILNADALDLERSPNAIAAFADGMYVIEASIFGFDRGAFDPEQPCRLVLSRPTTDGRTLAVDAVTRANNIGVALAGPTAILPGPLQTGDQAVINYSRTPYQGDVWGSQAAYVDSAATLGPLTTASAYAVASTQLDQDGVLRPNEKLVEVLASMTLLTTLGTGRLSGDLVDPLLLDVRNVGYENPASYPPVSGVALRPRTLPGALDAGTDTSVSAAYLGCTERLPLGALFRDKDFHGEVFSEQYQSPLVILAEIDAIATDQTALATSSTLGLNEVNLLPAEAALGRAGDLLVQTDGELSDYTQDLTFRVNRGGAVYVASGDRPGGELMSSSLFVDSNHANVLYVKAMLVRNTVTSVGAAEVSAGDELMLLIATTVARGVDADFAKLRVGTNGLGEGYSAVDLFRLPGRPLEVDHTRMDVDLTTIDLSRLTTTVLAQELSFMDFTQAFSAFAVFSFVLVALLAYGTTFVVRTVIEAVWENAAVSPAPTRLAKLWQKIFVPLGPMANGALLGFLPFLPWPADLLGGKTGNHVAFGFVAGMLANIVYARFRDFARGAPGDRGDTLPPAV